MCYLMNSVVSVDKCIIFNPMPYLMNFAVCVGDYSVFTTMRYLMNSVDGIGKPSVFTSMPYLIIIIICPLSARVVGAPQMISQLVLV